MSIPRLNSRGSITILTLVASFIFLAILAMASDIGTLYAAKIQGQHALNLACRAAASQLDMDALAEPAKPIIRIVPEDAEDMLALYLKKNLKLDDDLNPLPGALPAGPVSIEFFKTVTAEALPYSYSYEGLNETANRPGVIAIIKFPVRLGPFAQFATEVERGNMANIVVHVRVEPEIITND